MFACFQPWPYDDYKKQKKIMIAFLLLCTTLTSAITAETCTFHSISTTATILQETSPYNTTGSDFGTTIDQTVPLGSCTLAGMDLVDSGRGLVVVFCDGVGNTYLQAPTDYLQDGMRFGHTLALANDSTLLFVAAPAYSFDEEEEEASNAGLVFVYSGCSESSYLLDCIFENATTLRPQNLSDNIYFGVVLEPLESIGCVAISSTCQTPNPYSGAVYLFCHGVGGQSWNQTQKLQSPFLNTSSMDQFGRALASSANRTFLFVSDALGTVYFYKSDGDDDNNDLSLNRTFVAPNEDDNVTDSFGTSLAFSDRTNCLFIGSPEAGACGRVYVYCLSSTNYTQTIACNESLLLSSSSFGVSLSVSESNSCVLVGATNASFLYCREDDDDSGLLFTLAHQLSSESQYASEGTFGAHVHMGLECLLVGESNAFHNSTIQSWCTLDVCTVPTPVPPTPKPTPKPTAMTEKIKTTVTHSVTTAAAETTTTAAPLADVHQSTWITAGILLGVIFVILVFFVLCLVYSKSYPYTARSTRHTTGIRSTLVSNSSSFKFPTAKTIRVRPQSSLSSSSTAFRDRNHSRGNNNNNSSNKKNVPHAPFDFF